MTKDSKDQKPFPRTDVQSILFFSKMLNQAKQNYWFTKLKVVEIVWVIKKVRHMVESIKKLSVVVYIDYSAAVSISRQISLTTSSTDKLNLRLVRASQYLSMFDLFVRHKANKTNIVSNTLSRLQDSVSITINEPEVLEALYEQAVKVTASLMNIVTHKNSSLLESYASYHVTLIEMSDDFKARLFKEYAKDEQ